MKNEKEEFARNLEKQMSELEFNHKKLSSEHSRSKKSRDFFFDETESKDGEILRLMADIDNKKVEIQKLNRIIDG